MDMISQCRHSCQIYINSSRVGEGCFVGSRLSIAPGWLGTVGEVGSKEHGPFCLGLYFKLDCFTVAMVFTPYTYIPHTLLLVERREDVGVRGILGNIASEVGRKKGVMMAILGIVGVSYILWLFKRRGAVASGC
jgi:hypothetical protein